MIQPIYLYGSEVLRRKAEPMDISDAKAVESLVKDLEETLRNSEGVGLAAPQIGVSRRVLVVDGREMTDVYPYLKDFFRVMINPEVLEESAEKCEYSEGCLSVPGIYADVARPRSIRVAYYDRDLVRREEVLDKFACRMVQHEMSHLDGELFTDLVAPIRKKMLAKKLNNITQGRVATRYKARIK